MQRITTSAILISFISITLNAVTLVVDKENGPYTSIRAADRDTEEGDTVLVYGGVYNENVGLRRNGTAGAPTVYMAAPGEEVILDGSQVVTGWERCASAADCGGNPYWENIYKVTGSRPLNLYAMNLYEGEHMLTVVQSPETRSRFFDKYTDDYRLIPTGGLTLISLTDPAFFTQGEDGYWTGGYALVLTGNNFVYTRRITGYDGGAGRITFEPLPSVGIEYGKDKFAVANHVMLLDKPGRFYADEENRTIYLWPNDPASLDAGEVTMSTRTNAMLATREHVVIDGFIFRRYYDTVLSADGARGVVVRNCEFHQNQAQEHMWVVDMLNCQNVVFEDNHVHHNKHNRGVRFQDGTGNVIRNNLLDMNGGTGINVYGETGALVEGNVVLNHRGQHANGITTYNGNNGVTVRNNFVRDGGVAFTYQGTADMTVVNNVFHSKGWAAACWNGSSTRNVTFLHNAFVCGDDTYSFRTQGGTISGLVCRNNVFKGLPAGMHVGTFAYNTYINTPSYNPSLSAGEQLVELAGTFRDRDRYDYRPLASSPQVNAGADAGVAADFYGTARTSPDAGPFEYAATDGTGPSPVSAVHDGETHTLSVTFDRDLDPLWAKVVTNYELDNDQVVARAYLQADGRSVKLHVSRLAGGAGHTLTVNHVRDTEGDPCATDAAVAFTAAASSNVSGHRHAGATTELPALPNPCSCLRQLQGYGDVFTARGARVVPGTDIRGGVFLVHDAETGAVRRLVVIDQ